MRWAYLDLSDFLLVAGAILMIPADALAQSDRIVALAESALAAPAASFGGEEFYPELPDEAAVLCSHLVRNHPLPDGNKRVAYLCPVEFVERNGCIWEGASSEAEEDEVVAVIVRLASGELLTVEFADWVRDRIRPQSPP